MSCTSRIATTTHAAASLSDGADGWIVATSFGDPQGEAAACRRSVAISDVSNWGIFRLSGANAVKYLQGLVSNDVAKLDVGEGCYAAFLNVHGRIEADVHIFRFEDGLVLHTPPEAADWLEKSLGRFRLAGGFDLERLGERHAMIAVLGPETHDLLERITGGDAPERLRCGESSTSGASIRLLGVPRCQTDSIDILGGADEVAELWHRLREAGAVPVGTEALEIARLEAGIARFGRDFDNDTVLQEADCPEIVSYQKGCYLGQEIVARLHFQGQPSKLLRRIEITGDILPEPGDEVIAGDESAKSAGRVTSSSSATEGGPTVFAIVKRRFYEPGTPVRIRRGDSLVGGVVTERRPSPQTGKPQ